MTQIWQALSCALGALAQSVQVYSHFTSAECTIHTIPYIPIEKLKHTTCVGPDRGSVLCGEDGDGAERGDNSEVDVTCASFLRYTATWQPFPDSSMVNVISYTSGTLPASKEVWVIRVITG